MADKLAPAEIANRVLEACESTNDSARRLAEDGFPHGTWVSARTQTRGRGRQGKTWRSLEGNLFLSMIVRFDPSVFQARATWIPLASAVAVLRVAHARVPQKELRIKWPNDLWVGEMGKAGSGKLGGILCEAAGAGAFTVVGIGVNCTQAPGERLDYPVASLGISADEIRAPIIESLREVFRELAEKGTDGIAREYDRAALLGRGQKIEWGEGQAGVVEGLGSAGELVVRVSEGKSLRLFAEDVRAFRFRSA